MKESKNPKQARMSAKDASSMMKQSMPMMRMMLSSMPLKGAPFLAKGALLVIRSKGLTRAFLLLWPLLFISSIVLSLTVSAYFLFLALAVALLPALSLRAFSIYAKRAIKQMMAPAPPVVEGKVLSENEKDAAAKAEARQAYLKSLVDKPKPQDK